MAKNEKKLSTEDVGRFAALVSSIEAVHTELSARAAKSVNVALTMRNWLIGNYIVEFEQDGADEAKYGEKLIVELSKELKSRGVSRTDRRELSRYRRFYLAYPKIGDTLSPQFKKGLIFDNSLEKREISIGDSLSPLLTESIMSKLSFSHFRELIECEPAEKRTFYETECIAGSWSVRELKRQINSLLYERSQLSTDKQKLNELTNDGVDQQPSKLTIRDPYIFEFIGLKAAEVMSESHLEHQLLDKLQEFLLELGHGFCFEARQRRILIGDTYNYIDLVFYHRILKCHVLVDLKLEAFSHENIGQLNTYVSWYEKNVRADDDNPPIGILLCTDKDSALAEYALAGMNNELFVSKYQLELPSKELLQSQIEAERNRLAAESGSENETEQS